MKTQQPEIDPESLPLFKNAKFMHCSQGPALIISADDNTYKPLSHRIMRKKRTISQKIQQEKFKRLHEDYLISLVECGINIPKDKIDLFKTLFLKHYK